MWYLNLKYLRTPNKSLFNTLLWTSQQSQRQSQRKEKGGAACAPYVKSLSKVTEHSKPNGQGLGTGKQKTTLSSSLWAPTLSVDEKRGMMGATVLISVRSMVEQSVRALWYVWYGVSASAGKNCSIWGRGAHSGWSDCRRWGCQYWGMSWRG